MVVKKTDKQHKCQSAALNNRQGKIKSTYRKSRPQTKKTPTDYVAEPRQKFIIFVKVWRDSGSLQTAKGLQIIHISLSEFVTFANVSFAPPDTWSLRCTFYLLMQKWNKYKSLDFEIGNRSDWAPVYPNEKNAKLAAPANSGTILPIDITRGP